MAAVPAHHNVVTVHSTGIWKGSPYLVLDYVGKGPILNVRPQGPNTPLPHETCVARSVIRVCGVLPGP